MILSRLSDITGSSQESLLAFSETASFRYKTYEIAKKTGGYRKIHHPSRELKSIQRIISRIFISNFPIHEAATAYRPGHGIKGNALAHVDNQFLLRLDFENFFPSLTSENVKKLFKTKTRDQREVDFLSKIVCRFGKLTIGAPSSPILSNALMHDFDMMLNESVIGDRITYTRYADDLFFSCSTKNVLQIVPNMVHSTIHKANLGLTINGDKTIFTSKKRTRAVAGIILSSENKLSVGRKRKRNVKSLVFRLMQNLLSLEEKEKLIGEISYICSIEDDFLKRLSTKFGPQLLLELNNIKSQLKLKYQNNTTTFLIGRQSPDF